MRVTLSLRQVRRCQICEDTLRDQTLREDNMTTSRISAGAIALSIAFGSGGGVGSTQGSAKDQKLSGTIASSKRLADGKEWTTANLNVNTSSSYCYDDAEPVTAVDMAACIRGNRRSEDVSR
jgi:uncharacterized protein YfiM (DUF2279 family)